MVTDRDKIVAGDPHKMVLAQKHLPLILKQCLIQVVNRQ